MILYQLILSHLLFDYGKALTPEMIKAKSKGYPYIPIAKHAMLHAIGIFIILFLNNIGTGGHTYSIGELKEMLGLKDGYTH